ncbi:MAG: hypothetical protein Aurels2KO_41940 [Aureliella sp.]
MSESDKSFEMGDNAAQGQQSPISVALLFYLVTISGIAAACVRSLTTSEFATWTATAQCAIGTGLFGMVSGIVAGFVYRSRGLDFFLMPIVGSIVGAFSGLLLLVSVDQFYEVVITAFLGCWLLIVCMLVAARLRPA